MLEKIKEILVEQLNCDADSINEDTSFKDDLGADSLDLYEMVMALEDEYGIEIDTDELTDLSTVGDFMEYLKHLRGSKMAGDLEMPSGDQILTSSGREKISCSAYSPLGLQPSRQI